MRYELDDIFRSDLDNKVLEYIKQLGTPDSISYGNSRERFQAYLTYEKPHCNPCYGQSWICENCSHKRDGQDRYNKIVKQIELEIMENITNLIRGIIDDKQNKEVV